MLHKGSHKWQYNNDNHNILECGDYDYGHSYFLKFFWKWQYNNGNHNILERGDYDYGHSYFLKFFWKWQGISQ